MKPDGKSTTKRMAAVDGDTAGTGTKIPFDPLGKGQKLSDLCQRQKVEHSKENLKQQISSVVRLLTQQYLARIVYRTQRAAESV